MSIPLFDHRIIDRLCIKRHTWLWIKYCWYKYIKRLNIIGFYCGKPIIRTEKLEEYYAKSSHSFGGGE